MAFKPALRNFLLGKASVTAKVGEEVHLDKLPQNAGLPSIVLVRLTEDPQYDLDGGAGLQFDEWDIEVRAATSEEADGIAAIVDGLLSGKRQDIDTQTDVVSLKQGGEDDYEKPEHGGATGRHVRILNYQFQL